MAEQSTKTYPLPAPVLQAIVNYLQTKPWAEVNNLLAAIQQVAQQVDGAMPIQMPGPSESSFDDKADKPVKKKAAVA